MTGILTDEAICSPSTKAAASKAYGSKITPKEDPGVWSLVEDYIPLVKASVARMRMYFPSSVDSEDIYSIALTGLINAAKNYDTSKGKCFGVYAKIRVKGALLDELRRMDHLSRDGRSATKKFQSSIAELEQRFQRKVSVEEVCEHLNISKREYEKLMSQKRPVMTPLDMPLFEGDNKSPALSDIISDPTEQDSRDIAENSDLVDALKESIRLLEGPHQKVLALYYLDELRLAEIATLMKLSESRISQIHTQALTQLRKLLSGKMAA
jgi:RNA polymerase sigma factor for flagellar operon FliA